MKKGISMLSSRREILSPRLFSVSKTISKTITHHYLLCIPQFGVVQEQLIIYQTVPDLFFTRYVVITHILLYCIPKWVLPKILSDRVFLNSCLNWMNYMKNVQRQFLSLSSYPMPCCMHCFQEISCICVRNLNSTEERWTPPVRMKNIEAVTGYKYIE